MSGRATRLYPLPPREIPAHAIYGDLALPPAQRRDAARPYVVINLVASVDGRVTVGGKASSLGSETDRQTMRNLRARADAVMIGAGTLRAEKLSLGLDDETHLPRRQPLAVIVTAGGDLPLESNLVFGEGQDLLVISSRDLVGELPDATGRVLVVPPAGRAGVDLGAALEALKYDYAVDLLLVEGGPTLSHALASASLADELFLTLAPKLLGGTREEALAILSGPSLPNEVQSLVLLSAYLAGDELYLRYEIR